MTPQGIRVAHPDYFIAPRSLPRQDFWRQVKRTVHGHPVDETQIAMIVDAVIAGLRPQSGDVVLDLACGNGALSSRLFPACAGLVGVDYSDYLISVADEFFADPPRRHFLCQDAASFVVQETHPERYTKVLCYGSFAYLTPTDATTTLRALADRFTAASTVFLGNLPDRDRAAGFFTDGVPPATVLADPASAVGIWRTEEELAELADACGWRASFRHMPSAYYAAHYRYDAVLVRR